MFIKLFHVICFGIGDITNRKHNIFGSTKVDDGGNSANKPWMEYLRWLITEQPKQFVRFLPLIVEYVGLRELVTIQIKTKKGTPKVEGTYGILALILDNRLCKKALIDLLESFIRGNNPFKKHLVAKFVKIPRTSKRISRTH